MTHLSMLFTHMEVIRGSIELKNLMNLVTKLSDRIGVLEDDLKKTKKTYSSAYTKLILRVKKLESQIKTGKARRKARVVLSDNEVIEDDSSKQGRKLSDAEIKSSEKGSAEVSTGAKKGTASEEVPIVSTAEVNLSTAGETVTYTRRSAEKRTGARERNLFLVKKTQGKRQKMEEDAEKEELKGYLDIIPRERNVEELYRLVKKKYSASRLEGFDLMLWGDLYTLFESDEEDEIWKNQHEYNLISWRLCDFCGIHIPVGWKNG
ncbi:hypothetical protein Tco_1090461 [Tanacetum coccineum]|uniref:Uncharacterized protein n=1 Tax=Tanacetum coccineum TaxID=301880 RepID=A0ABQ5I6B1_9ASTR